MRSRWILLSLIISIASFPLHLYATETTTDLKHEIELLKNQLQNIENRIALTEQSTVVSSTGTSTKNNTNANVTVPTATATAIPTATTTPTQKMIPNNVKKPILKATNQSSSKVALTPIWDQQIPYLKITMGRPIYVCPCFGKDRASLS